MNVPFENQITTASPTAITRVDLANLGALRAYQMRHARTWMSVLLAVSDMFWLTIAGLLAVSVRLALGGVVPSLYLRFVSLPVLFVVVYTLRQLYPAIGLGAVEEFRRLTINTTFVFLIIVAVAYMGQIPAVYSRLIFFLYWLLALVLVPLGRAVTRIIFTRLKLWGEPVAVIGPPAQAGEIADNLRHYPKVGLSPAMVCKHGTCRAVIGREALTLPDHGMTDACRQCPVSLARMALVVYSDYNQLEAVREKYRDMYERLILVNHLDNGLGLSGVSVREFGGLTGLEIRQNLLDHWSQTEKRIIDLISSGVGLLLLSPLFLIIAALTCLDSPRRIFYRQMRVGKGGKIFQMLKFRTMHHNADAVLQSYLERDPGIQAEWDQYQKLCKDPRITRVGGFLRRFSIDELPQLWNVFTGDMSLVGPRPIMLNQQEMYGQLFEHYMRVTPGITGLWQISGRNKTTFARRAEFDRHYVMNWSIWLDLYILVRTVWVVIRRDGAA